MGLSVKLLCLSSACIEDLSASDMNGRFAMTVFLSIIFQTTGNRLSVTFSGIMEIEPEKKQGDLLF
jgi:hypothetical protein